MDVPSQPEPVWGSIASDEYIRGLGRVVYEANRLETVAADLLFGHEHMTGKEPHIKHPTMLHAMSRRAPVDGLIKLLSALEPDTDWAKDRVQKHLEWAKETRRLLTRRNQYTHVVYIQFDDHQVCGVNVHADKEAPFITTLDSPNELLELAAEMLAHRHAGERIDLPETVDMPLRPGGSLVFLSPWPNPFQEGESVSRDPRP